MSVAIVSVDDLLRQHGLGEALPMITEYVAAQRWSGAVGRGVRAVGFDDAALLSEEDPTLLFTVLRFVYEDGASVRYALPLGLRGPNDLLAERAPEHVIGRVATPAGERLLYDALGDPQYVHWLWAQLRQAAVSSTAAGELRFERPDAGVFGDDPAPAVRPLRVEQSNTSLEIGDTAFLKHLRRIEPGPAHELEMAAALRGAGFTHFVPIWGSGVYAEPGVPESPFVLAQPYLHNATEGWALALTSLRDLYADAEELDGGDAMARRVAVDEQRAAFLGEAARLGAVVAEMHNALASPSLAPAFEPTAIDRRLLRSWADEMTADLDALLTRRDDIVDQVRPHRTAIVARFDALRGLEPSGLCIRVHGDLHLGQVLRTDAGWIILDFEGEPGRTPEQRRSQSTPLRDVAGMLRSFDYAAAVALAERMVPRSREWAELTAYGDAWAQANRDAFWAAYLETAGESALLPGVDAALVVRRAFEVQKAVYELAYELDHRPAWAPIPLRFLTRGTE